MVGPNFMDEIDCGGFFDHIDDLLDFPVEDVDGAGTGAFPAAANAGNCNSLASIWPPESDSFPGSDSVFSGNSASDLSAELSVPVSWQNVVVLMFHILFCLIKKKIWHSSHEFHELLCNYIKRHGFGSFLLAVRLPDYDII